MVRLAYSWEKSPLLLAHYFRVTLFIVFWLSSTQAAICKPRESPEGKRLYFSSPFLLHYVVINSHMSDSCFIFLSSGTVFFLRSERTAPRSDISAQEPDSLKMERLCGKHECGAGRAHFEAANNAPLCLRRQFCSQRLLGEERTRRLAGEAEVLLREPSPRAAGLSPQE